MALPKTMLLPPIPAFLPIFSTDPASSPASAPPASLPVGSNSDTTYYANPARVLVGKRKREFTVDGDLLAAASPAFREGLEASSLRNKKHHRPCIWLADESPAMFELFTIWLHRRANSNNNNFRNLLDNTIKTSHDTPDPDSPKPEADHTPAQRLHWILIRLHLFAARLGLLPLQDMAMDAIQDLYLRRNWDVSPRLIHFMYSQQAGAAADDGDSDGPQACMRLRRWTVAMVAWQVAGGPASIAAPLCKLLERYPDFGEDYRNHLRKMGESRLDVRIKNPQLRIPANRLRSEERQFAFRQCSFHSHRAAVGERRCPHHHHHHHHGPAALNPRLQATPMSSQQRQQQRRQQPTSQTADQPQPLSLPALVVIDTEAGKSRAAAAALSDMTSEMEAMIPKPLAPKNRDIRTLDPEYTLAWV